MGKWGDARLLHDTIADRDSQQGARTGRLAFGLRCQHGAYLALFGVGGASSQGSAGGQSVCGGQGGSSREQ